MSVLPGKSDPDMAWAHSCAIVKVAREHDTVAIQALRDDTSYGGYFNKVSPFNILNNREGLCCLAFCII